MKSIKNQYIALKEGKMTEAQFMRNVRMTLPEYISNVTLFKQAERILINKRIISEIKIEETHSSNPNDRYEVKFSKENDTYQVWEGDTLVTDFATKEKADAEAKRLNIKQDAKKLDKKQSNESLKEGVDMGELEDTLKRVKKDNPGKKVSYFFTKDNPKGYKISIDGKHINEAKDTSAIGYYNQDGKEQYSKFDELDNMNAQEIMAGYVLEKIDNPDLDKKAICKIVIKNLNKDQFYYTNYKLTGVAGLKPTEFTTTKRKSFFDQMEELDKNGSNLVDEKNKMVVVKEGLEIQEAYQKGDKVTFTNKNSDKTYKGTVVQDLGDGKFTFTAEDGKTYSNKELRNNWKISKEVVEIQESENDLVAIADDIYNELQALGSYDDTDVAELLKTYPKLSPEEEKEIEVIIFDKDREELMREASTSESQKTKLKEMVKKMMKEMFDGRDNVTDVTGENV